MHPRMRYDDVAWEKSEAVADEWVRQFIQSEILHPVGNFLIRHHRPGDTVEFSFLEKGAYNISFQMKYKNANAAIIRFPQPGATMFPEEKVRNEVATMRYIYDLTSIPVPFVHHWGTKKESPLELGSFIIIDYIDHDTNMYDALNTPECPKEDRGTLDPDISEAKLEALYKEVASILLQLSRPSLPRIGSLDQVDDFTWKVTHRPLSMPKYSALAELHITHLIDQRNDAVDSAEDCRRKLVARYLFRKLAREHRLTKQWAAFNKGPFKLWCDDFRPGNILLNKELKITAVVDWEFTYAAPVEFSFAPPWWLLIEKPEYWPQGLDDWCSEYERRLQTFLSAMRDQEDKAIEQGWLKRTQRLSRAMQDSWESGDFWIAYAARNSFAFDLVYWHKIDQRFFGRTSSPIDDVWKQRLELLGPEERAEIEESTKEFAEKHSEGNAATGDEIRAAEAAADDGGHVGLDKLAELSL
ncbi:kinase-like domain-containing protein [Aspergillus crustosus]